MNNAPVFDKSFLPPMMSVLNSDYWGTVMNIWESGKKKETIHAVLDYIKPGLSSKSLDADKSRYSLPHGSIMVSLEITPEKYTIYAPFLKIPAASLIPMIRQIADINFNTLILAQIYLVNNEIYFYYESPLELCDPYKLYRVLEEICIQADANDDVFIDKFGAQRFSQMQVEYFTQEQLDLCNEKFRQYLQQALDYVAYFESKRIEAFCWDAFYIAYTQLDYFIRPQGVLKAEIEKAVREINSQAPINERVSKAKNIVKGLMEMSKEKFSESIYKSQQFISEKVRFEVSGAQNYLQKNYNTANDEMNRRDYMGATLSLMTGIYGILFYYNVPQSIYDILIEGMEKASNKPWATAAESLWQAYDQVMKLSNKPITSSSGVRL